METTNDILCEMRTLGQIYNKSTEKITRSLQSLGLRSYADRFEAARRRETVTICNHLNEILNEANGIAESVISPYLEEKALHIYNTCKNLCKQIDLQGNGAAMREATCEKSSQVGNEPMTLDEAIAHAEEAVNDTPCGQEHKQLADWLKELREIKNSNGAECREALVQIRDSVYIDPDDNKCHSDIDASDLREICDAALAAPPEPIGNSAKLREALKRCVTMLDICLLYSHEGYPEQNDDIRDVMAKAENALAAPVNTKPTGNVNNDSAIYNGAETRQALVAIHALLGAYVRHEITADSLCLRIKDTINAALAAPPRNCDLFESHIADDEFEKAMRFPPSKTADERDELMRENWYLFKLWLYAEAKAALKHERKRG